MILEKIKTTKKRILLLWIGLFSLLFFMPFAGAQVSEVPMDYFANYKIQKDWERLSKLFVDIDANRKIGVLNNSATFAELNGIMKRVFPYFPQDYSSQVLYQQCYTTLESLQKSVERDNFSIFYENCYKPVQALTTTINSKYTIKAQGAASPASGPAPLTVTFDARSSHDPSLETIPQRNYFRYYRDIDGVDKPIGVGSVIKHTFKEAGTYMVHLVVRSSQTGILDGEKTISVNVSPKSAVIAIYANAKKLDKNKAIKFGIQEARQGIVFDGSATMPMGGREILSHKWDITGSDGFRFSRSGEGIPGYFNLPLPGQGQYKITLTVSDNEKNQISESFSIMISDPVAILRQSPEVGTTSTTFSFSSDASYSLTSRLRLITWEIFNAEGEKIDTFQTKSIQKKFTKPGNYVIKLTVEDEIGQHNSDSVMIMVESTPPVPQFSITPTNKWLYPSEFYLDASASFDVDVASAGDEMTFNWSFSNPNMVKITERDDHNQKIKVLFNEMGKHTVTLQVTDKYGKTQSIDKIIEVKSTIRPELTINPKASVWKNYVDFIVTSNQELVSYEWNFGDGNQRVNQRNSMKYQYDRVGTYQVAVKVSDDEGNSNQIVENVFIGEKDSPIPVYFIRSSQGLTLTQDETCPIDASEGAERVLAYRVKRQDSFTIDTSDSVNVQGNKNSLNFSFQAKNKDIIKTQKIIYTFDTVGCQYIDYTLEDTSIGVNTKERIWFKVVNSLPTLDNVVLSFPQYGNEMGIGFNQNTVRNIFDEGIDPIIVRVAAQNPKDKDGVISYYKWYYYPKDNPNKILGTKITPSDIPYTYFSIPRQPGEFMFGVTMYDNDDGKQSSEEIIGNGPVVFFPPDTKQPDIPLVTLKSDKVNVEVGEEITFDVIAKILSERADFVKERTIQIDFDGDGEIDLTTKDDRIKYIYSKPSPEKEPYRPVAYVSYRGYKGQGEGNTIQVKNAIKPALIYTNFGKTVIIKDISMGDIIEREVCFDVNECEKGNKNYLNKSLDKLLIINYPDYGEYQLTIKIKDSGANEVSAKQTIVVAKDHAAISVATGVSLLTVPEAQMNQYGIPEIFVGKALHNEVVFYIDSRSVEGYCFADIDIDVDSDGDGFPDNDKDIYCNKPYLQPYMPTVESAKGRIYFLPKNTDTTTATKPLTQDFIVTFADFDNGLDENTNKVYEKINQLLTTLDDQKWIANANLRVLLTTLRNQLGDQNSTRENVIQINQFIKDHPLKLTEGEEKLLGNILIDLQDFVTLSAEGENTYVLAKNEILSLLPLELKTKIQKVFQDFDVLGEEGGVDILDKRKELLLIIFEGVEKKIGKGSNIQADEIFKEDFDETFIPNYCKIVEYFSINDNVYCKSYYKDGEIKDIPQQLDKDSSNKSTFKIPLFVKILIWVVGIAVLSFAGIIAFYAIKAKMKQPESE